MVIGGRDWEGGIGGRDWEGGIVEGDWEGGIGHVLYWPCTRLTRIIAHV